VSDCQQWQEEMDEVLAFGGTEAEFSQPLTEHLATCEPCRDFCSDGLLLNQMMEEPVPLPPADLVPNVMAQVAAAQTVDVRLPWAERLAWAASGAVSMFFIERIPEYSFSWLTDLQQVVAQVDWSFPVPMAASASTLVLAALTLATVQGTLVYRTRAVI
jgi:predicted anti-sigma-YlaC factor YlaD